MLLSCMARTKMSARQNAGDNAMVENRIRKYTAQREEGSHARQAMAADVVRNVIRREEPSQAVVRQESSGRAKKTTSGKPPRKALCQRIIRNMSRDGTVTRRKPGTVALREIRKHQKSTTPLLLRAPFRRLVREIALQFRSEIRITGTAIEALQEATESFIVARFEEVDLARAHRKAKTIDKKDWRLIDSIQHLLPDSNARWLSRGSTSRAEEAAHS